MTDEPIDTRGVYLMADTPLSAHPLLLEDGSGDKQLLAEVLCEDLSDDELQDLHEELHQEALKRQAEVEA